LSRNYWFTLKWANDPGGAQLLSGELLLIAGVAVLLFAGLTWPTKPLPILAFGLGPIALSLGAVLTGWGIYTHTRSGLAWWDWDWEGDGS
jgi:hypothetical protein